VLNKPDKGETGKEKEMQTYEQEDGRVAVVMTKEQWEKITRILGLGMGEVWTETGKEDADFASYLMTRVDGAEREYEEAGMFMPVEHHEFQYDQPDYPASVVSVRYGSSDSILVATCEDEDEETPRYGDRGRVAIWDERFRS
jgi:hypothetical protein